jgi:hypothetical protein
MEKGSETERELPIFQGFVNISVDVARIRLSLIKD